MKNPQKIYFKIRGNEKTRLMLNLFGQNQERDVFTILKIKHWVRENFELTEYETVLVTELQCHEEGCSPVETVIVLLKEGTGKEQYIFHKRMDEINFEDIVNLSTRRQM
jgi:hypothetical protein